ncbi:uncharacterized protein [Temnothorax longispinosus]|uniref:uncharacterized protein n=1 Tax=Temnothorax longispinosus TaxID=300112 RepID=UPI003A9A4E77
MNKKSCSKSFLKNSCSATAAVPVPVPVPAPVPVSATVPPVFAPVPVPAPVPDPATVPPVFAPVPVPATVPPVFAPVPVPAPVPVSELCDDDGMIGDKTLNQSSRRTKVKGLNWTDIETQIFIELCIEKRIIQLMDGKRHKHIDIYKSLEPNMKEMGFIKTGAQMKTKLKHLKEAYFKCKRSNSVSGAARMSFKFYDAMDQLLGGRPSVEAINNHGIDSSSAQDANNQILPVDEASNMEDSLINVEVEIEEREEEKENIKSAKKTSGRYTQVKLAQNFAEVFAKCQAQQMQGVIEKQMDMFNESTQAQMMSQRQWEKEMLEKEHDHQLKMLNNFMAGMQAMQHRNFQQPYPSNFHENYPRPPFSSTPIPFHLSAPFINSCGLPEPSPPISTSSSSSIYTTSSLPSSSYGHSFQTSTPMSSPQLTSRLFDFNNMK